MLPLRAWAIVQTLEEAGVQYVDGSPTEQPVAVTAAACRPAAAAAVQAVVS